MMGGSNMNSSQVFVCYSVPLMMFLTKSKGIRYDVVGLNPKTKKTFWAFVKNKELSETLSTWRDNNPNYTS